MGTSLNGLTPANTYQALIKVGNNTNLNTTLKTLSDGAGNDLPMQASTTAINFTGTVSGVASGVSGAIQFSNGSAFASDANNLFWDDTNNRLGIGTNAPTESLQVQGNVLSGGGTKLVLTGESFALQTIVPSGAGGMVIGTNANTPSFIDILSANQFFHISNRASSNRLGIYSATFVGTTATYSSELLTLTTVGSLGIGETAPSARVQIKGSGSTSATTSLLVQNSSGSTLLSLRDDKVADFNSATILGVGTLFTQVVTTGYINSSGNAYSVMRTNNSTGNATFDQFVAIGTTSAPNASAALDVVSTTKGFLPPRMTTTQKNAIASPATGLQVFDSTMNATCEYTGTAWRVVSAGAQAVTVTGLLQTVSLANGNVLDITLNSTTTFTFTNPTIGTYILKLTQGVGGGFLVNWPVNVIWSGGTAPTLSTTAGKIDIITLIYDGTSYYGNYSLNY